MNQKSDLKNKGAADIRNQFLSYFEKNGHRVLPSSRLIPEGDPTLLFTNAGMNQFKHLFLGLETRDYKRASTSQKCVRAGGKHNDLENVGFTARHHTFFEMLGNFSFGDYFKKDAIHFGWEFITKTLALDPKRLYVSVFEKDDEAADIWHKQEGVARDRIYKFGEKDNFWRMGNSGPCGPCSEIFYDLGDQVPGNPKDNVMGGSGDRFMEIWNLVFMQFNETEDGKQTPLPKPSVDTGMGLERLTSVMQGQISNYDTDLFQPIIQTIEKATGIEYIRNFKNLKADQAKAFDASNVAMRVLADHARATTFLIADGVTPSNEGRGYVLRRIMRRAIRYGRNLHEELSLLPKTVEKVIELMGEAYPEIVAQKNHILNVTRDEEKRFFQTLDQGLQILGSEFTSMEKLQNKVVSGKFVFKLYDTFGFPADLTRVIAREKGFEIDETSFDKQVEDAREVARASWKGKSLSTSDAELYKDIQTLIKSHGSTKFTGYEGQTSEQGTLLLAFDGSNNVAQLKSGQRGILISDKTSFYAESGGQVGDTGQITGTSGTAEVLDCTKSNEIYLHHVLITDGILNVGEKIQMSVHPVKRRQTANNHSGTHLLHAALRKVLGSQVTQAGSQVTPERLRFDFTYNKPMTSEEIATAENLVNNEISRSLKVETKIMTPKEAVAQGALALFGEKYGDQVRVLRMGDFSTELCGGTHVDNTSAIRFLKIVSEVGVSSGVRRIEAITGDMAAQFLYQHTNENLAARNAFGMQEGWQQYLQGQKLKVADAILQLKEENKVLIRERKNLKSSSLDFDLLLKQAQPFTVQNQTGHFLFADLDGAEGQDREVLNQITDRLRDKIKSGVIVMLGRAAASSDSNTSQKSDTKDSSKPAELSHPLIVSLTPNLVGPLHAGKILGQLAAILGGKGGGRPDFAQGAAKDLSKIFDAKKKLQEILSS